MINTDYKDGGDRRKLKEQFAREALDSDNGEKIISAAKKLDIQTNGHSIEQLKQSIRKALR